MNIDLPFSDGFSDWSGKTPMRRVNGPAFKGSQIDRVSLPNRFAWLVVGLLCQIKIAGIGEIYGGELIALPLLLLALARKRVARWEFALFGWCLLWSCAQFFSDLINQTEFGSLVKGVGAPAIFAVTTIAFSRNLKNRTIGYFLAGTAISAAIQQWFSPSDYQMLNPWKWGYGQDVMTLGLVILSFFRPRSRFLTPVLIAIFAIVCLLNNSRSMAAFPVVGYALYELSRVQMLRSPLLRISTGVPILKLVVPIVLAIAAVNLAAFAVFSSGVTDSLLSAEVNAKFKSQATSSAGLILAGRSESLISTRAFLDSPLYGHGSWAKDKTGFYSREYVRLKYEAGVSDELTKMDAELIPAHSFFMGALVWAGIFGGVSWLMLANGVVKRYLQSAASLPMYFHTGIVLFLWNLMFSPFGADARWETALFFAALFSWTKPGSLKA